MLSNIEVLQYREYHSTEVVSYSSGTGSIWRFYLSVSYHLTCLWPTIWPVCDLQFDLSVTYNFTCLWTHCCETLVAQWHFTSQVCSRSRDQIWMMGGLLIAIVLSVFTPVRSVFHSSSKIASNCRGNSCNCLCCSRWQEGNNILRATHPLAAVIDNMSPNKHIIIYRSLLLHKLMDKIIVHGGFTSDNSWWRLVVNCSCWCRRLCVISSVTDCPVLSILSFWFFTFKI